MRTVTFQSVLWGVARAMGLKPKENLSVEQAETLTDYINRETRTAWQEFPWPELEVIEERFYRPVWEAAAYVVGDEVYHAETGAYYIAVTDLLGVDVPGTSVGWEQVTDLSRYVAWAQSGKDALGEVLGAWDRNPKVYDSAQLVPYWLGQDGVCFSPGAPSSVWLQYRLQPSVFTPDAWDASEIYVEADTVYDAASGECYMALGASENIDPAYSPDEWKRIPLPAVIAPYVTEAATALALKEDGQSDKARASRSEAELLLARAMQQFAVTQSQGVRYGASRLRQPR